MSIRHLVDSLRDRLDEVLADLLLLPADAADPDSPEGLVAPTVVSGPPAPPGASSHHRPPLVCVEPVGGQDGDEGADVELRLTVRTWRPDAQGWQDGANVVQRILSGLKAAQTLVDQYSLILPVVWNLPEVPPMDYWEAEITTMWAITTTDDIRDEDL